MLKKLNNFIYKLEEFIISFCLTIGILIVFINVILRYGFGTGLLWGLEATTYIIAWAILIGSAYGFGKKAHLGVHILIDSLKGKKRRILIFIALVLTIIFFIILFVNAIKYVILIKSFGDLSLDLKIPQWIPYMALPISLLLTLYHLCFLFIEFIKDKDFSLNVMEDKKLLEQHKIKIKSI